MIKKRRFIGLIVLQKRNNAQLHNLFGQCYENGWDVECDVEKANEYYSQATTKGYLE